MKNLLTLILASALCMLTVNTNAQLKVQLANYNPTTCLGGTVTYVAFTNATNPVTYQWAKNGVSISGATNSTLSVTPVNQFEKYIVTAKSGAETSSTTGYLTIYYPLIVTVTSTPMGNGKYSLAVSTTQSQQGSGILDVKLRPETIGVELLSKSISNNSATITAAVATNTSLFERTISVEAIPKTGGCIGIGSVTIRP